MPGDRFEIPAEGRPEPGRLGCAYLNPGALLVASIVVLFAVWQLWPLFAFALGG